MMVRQTENFQAIYDSWTAGCPRWERNWGKIAFNARQWWVGKLRRLLIRVRLKGKDPQRKESALPYHEFTSFYGADVPAEKIAECWDYELCCTEHMGDGFPHIWPSFGPGVLAAFMGAHLHNSENTSWFCREEILDIDRLHFKFSAESPATFPT